MYCIIRARDTSTLLQLWARTLPQGPAADYWALGITLAYSTTGRHPLHTRWREPVAAAKASSEKQESPRLTEAELNDATLHMPLHDLGLGPEAIAAQLHSLLSGLLQRDPARRLGAAGAHAVQQHAFFEAVEWELMAQGLLPAPFVPDPQLVYAKDVVLPLSEDERARAALVRAEAKGKAAADGTPAGQPGAGLGAGAAEGASADPEEATLDLAAWDFAGNAETFERELKEFVRKAPGGFWEHWW